MKTILFVLTSLLFLTGCEKSYVNRLSEIENFFKKERTGDSTDYFLVKNGLFGPDKVAVIFGFMNDFEFCNDISILYMKKYPADSYHCEAAN